ncbi:6367_t:CDS:2, partial [Gigaspora rosea]
VNEGVKCIIPERVMSIDPISNQFLDLFDAIMLGQYNNRVIKVFIRRKKSNGWQDLNNRLSDTSDSTQDGPNAFSILMANSRLPLLPRSCTKYNSYNRLYNEIIELFQAQKVGWMNALHETIRKTFVARLATLHYTSRFNVKFKVQSQMLRKESDDAHYCAALFRYLREFCIQYHQWFSLIAADDKHKIPIGEDIVVSTVHTAPNHSWTNPAKRIITNTLDDIHKKAHEYIKLESELKESIADVQEILNNHTERLQLKNNKFKCYFSASKEDITEIFESIFRINPTLKIKKTTQIQKCHHLELIKFIDTHCQARAYSFQQVYGTKTTEEHRPMYIQSQAKSVSIPKNILIAEKI